ncbi:MAG: hypothetical protein J6M06_01915 [Synergistaceae bacterium]|nr:hypothetical protein [Synergistaceae bacterium]
MTNTEKHSIYVVIPFSWAENGKPESIPAGTPCARSLESLTEVADIAKEYADDYGVDDANCERPVLVFSCDASFAENDGYGRLVLKRNLVPSKFRRVNETELPFPVNSPAEQGVINRILGHAGLPVIYAPEVFHVGKMDRSLKNEGSHEGGGLSVSLCPDEWRRISETTGGDTHTLRKDGALFLDIHGLGNEERNAIIYDGVASGYLVMNERYAFNYYDDELEDDYRMFFNTREEAEEEAESYGIKASCIEKESFPTPTKNLEKALGVKVNDNFGFDAYASLWAEQRGMDGAWWNDMLDPSRYSAPRGVITDKALRSWTVDGMPFDTFQESFIDILPALKGGDS